MAHLYKAWFGNAREVFTAAGHSFPGIRPLNHGSALPVQHLVPYHNALLLLTAGDSAPFAHESCQDYTSYCSDDSVDQSAQHGQ
ncbi:hypothetical protein CERZMDRAFT_91130 [Cercospora zeae-maydis SCOH1-5]|uniref:Uncharacterized protein n=1 Tax=Cercospora zeae-maydis SCOH1-5 TaxID=717836 RepID=A0A6A6FBG2_9PEZI|nr:hypothetical protein CERZMDRAFT_91130 [Cercospora zeae-maydis SCOH1-5]